MFVKHSSINRWAMINRWAIKFLPLLEEVFRRKYKRPLGGSWRMDETLHQGEGPKEISLSCRRQGKEKIDFLLRAKRDKTAAMRFFEQDMQSIPEKVTMDKGCANKAAIDQIIENQNFSIPVRLLGIELMHMIRKGQMMMMAG